MRGKIIKGIAGFYYVNIEKKGIFECKAKGAFRNEKVKPLVGDDVDVEIINDDEATGNIVEILPRKSEMIRPACANVDQALIIFSVKTPEPNFNLLDRFLIYMDSCGVDCVILFNKDDLSDEGQKKQIRDAYNNSGYKVLFVSAKDKYGIDELLEAISKKTTVVAGPSGVGKSSLINLLCGKEHMQTGAISEKNKRGKHTTRHSELLYVKEDTYILDTPGFTSLEVFGASTDNLKYFYDEFSEYNDKCRFRSCSHINEPDCAVQAALAEGKISKLRYENYVCLYNELKSIRKY